MQADGVGGFLLNTDKDESVGLIPSSAQATQVEGGLEIVSVGADFTREAVGAGVTGRLDVEHDAGGWQVAIRAALDLDACLRIGGEEAGLGDKAGIGDPAFDHFVIDDWRGDSLGQIVIAFGQKDLAIQIGAKLGLFPLVATAIFRAANDEVVFRLKNKRVDGAAQCEGGVVFPNLALPMGQRFGCDGFDIAAADFWPRVVGLVGHVADHFFLHP